MQHEDIKTIRHGQTGKSYELQIDPANKLILRIKKNESPSLIIGFTCNGVWYYQFLIWSCRGGKAFYYKPMIALYRHIRRNKLTDYSLRFIAGADCRLKNGGYAIGTETHKKFLEIGRRLDASRTRENRIMECLLGEIDKLALGPNWGIEKLSDYSFVINQRTTTAHVPTSAIFFRALMGSIFVQQFTGMTRTADETDPFRKMVNRKDGETHRFHDTEKSPEELVDLAMALIKKMMSDRVMHGVPCDLMAA